MITITPSTNFERTDGGPTWTYRFVESGTTLAALEFADRTHERRLDAPGIAGGDAADAGGGDDRDPARPGEHAAGDECELARLLIAPESRLRKAGANGFIDACADQLSAGNRGSFSGSLPGEAASRGPRRRRRRRRQGVAARAQGGVSTIGACKCWTGGEPASLPASGHGRRLTSIAPRAHRQHASCARS